MRLLSTIKRFFAHGDGAGVSAAWLLAYRQQETRRVGFEGQPWIWPINKIVNESARWNTRRLRRRG